MIDNLMRQYYIRNLKKAIDKAKKDELGSLTMTVPAATEIMNLLIMQEVVRCNDCKYYDGELCKKYSDFTKLWITEPQYFCADGRLREIESEDEEC